MNQIVLGFDPGGIGQFGWCIAVAGDNGRISIRRSGVASGAGEAHRLALDYVRHEEEVAAAGIDSPLFWATDGDRVADRMIRKAMTELGATNVHGTVQQVNSLRGACLAQGIMTAHLLRRETPGIRLTESHPKALLWLLKVASKGRSVLDVAVGDLAEFVDSQPTAMVEHERDAVLGAIAAFAMLRSAPGWRDLARDEPELYVPVEPVEYWMPLR